SGFIRPENLPFIRSLNLKTVICLSKDPYRPETFSFFEKNGIRVINKGMESTKESFDEMPQKAFKEVLEIVKDEEKRPLLIHCGKGKHRTGCLIGIYRCSSRWSLTSIFEEYNRYAGSKARPLDLQFIEQFHVKYNHGYFYFCLFTSFFAINPFLHLSFFGHFRRKTKLFSFNVSFPSNRFHKKKDF
ncbi:hypothetical protein MHBO_002211, partial [Bonamia ostreae]